MVTTIQLEEKTKAKLDSLKDFERETYEEVVQKLLNLMEEENMELSEQTKKDIEQARKEFREGKGISWEEVKKRAGLK